MGYTFLIQNWQEDGDEQFFLMRKIDTAEERNIRGIQDLQNIMHTLLGVRPYFVVKFNPDTREIDGYYYNQVSAADTHILDNSVKEILYPVLMEFNLKKLFEHPEGQVENIKRYYFEIEKMMRQITESIEKIKEWIEKARPTFDEYNALEEKIKRETKDPSVVKKLIFEAQRYYAYTQTAEPP